MNRSPGGRHLERDRILTWLLALLTVLAGAAVLWLCWVVVRALTPVLAVAGIGALLAVLLLPLADRLHGAIRSRPVAALAVVLLLLAPFGVVGTWLVTTVVRQAQGMLRHLPQTLAQLTALLAQAQDQLNGRFGIHLDLTSALAGGGSATGLHFNLVHALQNAGGGVLRGSVNVLSGVATVTTDTVLVLIVAFFLVWDGKAMARSMYGLLPANWRPAAQDVGRILTTVVADYVRGQFLVAVVFGLMVGASMQLLGLPDAVLLGFLAGLFELLPSVGPILASVGPVLLSLSQPFPHVLWVLAVLIGAQQLESNVLVPRISGGLVGLHPLTVILAVFAGWTLGGLGGAMLAVPTVGVARELLRRWWQPTIAAPRPRLWPAAGSAARSQAAVDPPPRATPPAEVTAVPAQPPPPPAPVAGRGTRSRSRQRG